MIKSQRGKPMIKIGNNTFCHKVTHKMKTTWVCSTHKNKAFEVIRSRKGNPLIRMDGYTFCKKGSSGVKTRWSCSTHNHKGCSALIHTVVEYVKSRRGRDLILLGGYTFCCQSYAGRRRRWVCSTHNHRKCRAVVHTYDDHVLKLAVYLLPFISIIRSHKTRNKTGYYSQPEEEAGTSSDIVRQFPDTCEYVPSRKTGRMMIKVGGYVFSQRSSTGAKKRWVCSTHVFRGCRAQIYTVYAVFVHSRTGRPMVLFGGYTYRIHRATPTKTRWVCSSHKHCRACLHTIDGVIVKVCDVHTH
ncbi:unnamed protein product, partial [Iphiclides podalirius]